MKDAAGWIVAGIIVLMIAGTGYLSNILRRQRIRSDAFGDGHFAATRHGHYHEGIDLEATPGEPVFSPITGRVVRFGYPYADSTAFRLIVIEGRGKVFKLMYVEPIAGIAPGDIVAKGEQVGYAQAISTRYGKGMRDHVHVELRTAAGALLDPAKFLRLVG